MLNTKEDVANQIILSYSNEFFFFLNEEVNLNISDLKW